MAAFITTTELIVWLNIPDDTFPTDTATAYVDAASDAIRGYCGWSISQETVTSEVHPANNRWDLWLPTKHLTAVASVVVDGVTLTHPDDYVWRRDGRITSSGRWINDATITYTHGYTTGTALGVAKAVCKQVAARSLTNPSSLRSEQVGGVSWTAAGTGEDVNVILTGGDQAMLENAGLALHGVA